MAQFPLGASQPMVDNTVDPGRIAQVVLQAIGNPSLGQAANFFAQPNLGSPSTWSSKTRSGDGPEQAHFGTVVSVL
ncbi:hypothetical protein AMTR_s00087p00080500 [Amborella trichopoda]|uniref:Uncharacterized protein n=1 Tax=Amborella trichopoda TaxID=13333 RepID=W1P3R5_AMBTC|nr:hypothetical protein AMTR_s00087p00080500 [Amborella trichopoda]